MSCEDQKPHCFGELDRVFPMGEEGLRESPEMCLACENKTACLRAALQGEKGWKAEEEKLDRAYASGHLGFLGRWSRRKALHQNKGRKAD
ncbi:hypothetical protein LZ24_01865 [Desulfobotulus alkaliphilus]|uniref:4Fe-4S Wbl-type domain-containing protein n=1 Tax=Desulfobotulus alkaliphilus TaxID=622671 RepID=A0A562RRE1_9BACT|nr:hypothetical protein [Desulfobotulus alkaliphilus]TWI71598.1 hypothetical protein LZ24_01865 [Desulfobotulus alkaliphilus]